MPGKASYQMYSWPQTRAAAHAFWALIRAAYGSGDADLTDYADPEQAWTDPDLLFSQTCGLPFRYRLKDKVRLLGTLDYGVPGCPPGYYSSCLIVHRDEKRRDLTEFQNTPFARNSVQSQSGWAAIEAELADSQVGFSFRDNILDTGSHAKSLLAVAEGRAGLASIDAVSWRFLQRYDRAAENVKVLKTTRPTPGLPLITGRGVNPEPLFAAVATAIKHLTPTDRDKLGLKGIVNVPISAYLAEPLPYPLVSASPG